MYIKKIFFIILILFLVFPCVTAGNNTIEYNTTLIQEPVYDEIVIADEDGHFNTSFSNDYNGYCLEYGEKEAVKGDKFYVVSMDYALSNTGEYIGDYLKTFFIDYHDIAIKDKIVTQHYIWTFSDNFHSWRINQSLVDYIKENPKHYPNDGIIKLNDTTGLKYSFRIFLSEYEHHQNYFAYQFDLMNITNNIIQNNNISSNNTQININNSNFNQSINFTFENKKIIKKIKNNEKIYLNKSNKTGNPVWILLFSILLIIRQKN